MSMSQNDDPPYNATKRISAVWQETTKPLTVFATISSETSIYILWLVNLPPLM